MKKLIFSLFLILLLATATSADDRFVLLGMEQNGCVWFIDRFSISKDSETGIISYWVLQKYSDSYRRRLMEMAQAGSNRDKYLAQRVAQSMIFQNINPKNKTFRNKEAILQDEIGDFLERFNFNEWDKIVPTSPVEAIFILLQQSFPQMFR